MKITFWEVSYALAYANLLHKVQNVQQFANSYRVIFSSPLTESDLSRLNTWPSMVCRFAREYNREVQFTDLLPVAMAVTTTTGDTNGSRNESEGAD